MDPVKDFINSNRDMFIQLTPDETTRLHGLLFQITDDILSFCDKHGLDCFLSGGTALGALRHNGFIPWDDDVDLTMPRKSYDIFRHEFPTEYPQYKVESPNTDNVGHFAYTKIKLPGTILMELISDENDCEVFVDVFPIEYAPESRIRRAFNGWYYNLLRDISYTILFAKQYKRVMKKDRLANCTLKTRFTLKAGYYLGSFLGLIPQRKWINHLDRIAPKKESSLMVIPTGLHNYKHELFRVDDYYPAKECIFEGRKAMLPHNVDRIMTEFYGPDYMTPPPDDKKAQHFFLTVSIGD